MRRVEDNLARSAVLRTVCMVPAAVCLARVVIASPGWVMATQAAEAEDYFQ